MKTTLSITIAGCLFALPGALQAAPTVPTTCGAGCVQFSGSGAGAAGGSTILSAQVFFEQSGSNLLVTLVNTGQEQVRIPSDVLTGVYFTLTHNSSLVDLAPLTAYVADRTPEGDFPNTSDARLANADNTTFNAAAFTDATGINVGGEFAYFGAPDFDFHGARAGISSSGVLNQFGAGNFCNNLAPKSPDPACPNIAGTDSSVNGMEAGIVPFSGFLDPNGGIKNHNPYIQSSVQFTLAGLPSGFMLTSGSLTGVGFQYGTSIDQPFFNAPAPATLALLGLGGLIGVLVSRRRKPH